MTKNDRFIRARRRALHIASAAVAGFAVLSGHAMAAYPEKPVTVVVPWPAGGPSDIAARPMSKGLAEALKQNFIVDNRAGAGGNIGTAMVSKAPKDGYTLLMTSSAPVVINEHLYKKPGFDPGKDLQPVVNLLRVPLVLVAHPSAKVDSVKDVIERAKKEKGDFTYASSGNGTPQHMTAELFKTVTGTEMVHVPYKGSAPAIADLLGGHVPIMFDSTVAIVPHIKGGSVKPLAVTGSVRSPLLPDVPTMKELGIDVESYAWYGFLAPAGTPREIVEQLNAEANKVMKTPEYQNVLKETGSEFPGSDVKTFEEFVKAERKKWGEIVKKSGATVD